MPGRGRFQEGDGGEGEKKGKKAVQKVVRRRHVMS